MRRVGERGDTAARAAGANEAHLLGKKTLPDRESLFRQRDQILASGHHRLKRKSAADEPGLQDSAVVGERDSRIEKIRSYPILPAVRLEIAVDHLPEPGRVAHALAQEFSLPARIEKVRLLL